MSGTERRTGVVFVLEYERFTELRDGFGSSRGGVYQRDDGSTWYLKYPNSERQTHNEVMASQFYDVMGFDAINYRLVDNGMVASEFREGLPDRSDPDDLRASETVQEVFLPSALLANWDVIGLVYDNTLYDPETMNEPVFLDFGGSFDTRAMGGSKEYSATSIPALDGFTDPSINQSAASVFEGMTPSLYRASRARIEALTVGEMRDIVRDVPLDAPDERLQTLRARADILLDTEYDEVFNT